MSVSVSASRPFPWDATEVMLKAGLDKKEDPMLHKWVQGYKVAFGWASCFPRLHVITYEHAIARVRKLFEGVPNVTGRPNNFAPPINAKYYMIQWHAVWADNFTSAPFVLIFDVDSVPVMPLRCHHLFDNEGRIVWRTWQWNHPPMWVHPCTSVFHRAQRLGAKYRTNLTLLTRGRRFEPDTKKLAAMTAPGVLPPLGHFPLGGGPL